MAKQAYKPRAAFHVSRSRAMYSTPPPVPIATTQDTPRAPLQGPPRPYLPGHVRSLSPYLQLLILGFLLCAPLAIGLRSLYQPRKALAVRHARLALPVWAG